MTTVPQFCRVPLSQPEVDESTVQIVACVLRGTTLSMGPRLLSFEEQFAEYLGCPEAVGVNSGTSALHLAVRVLGLEPGSEAITTPFSFIASANCLLFEDVRPVFVDIEPETFLMDLGQVNSVVTDRTSAILPVHVFGNPVNMQRVLRLADRHGLKVIEDACEALGGEIDGRKLGTFGDIGVFGFYPNKQMTTGEGGMAVTNNETYAARMRSLRNQGRSRGGKPGFEDLGYNYRMSEIAASLGACQLDRFEGFLKSRREAEARYCELLEGIEELHVPAIPPGRSPFVFIVQASSGALRDFLRKRLSRRGIQTAVYFRPIHLESFYRERFGFRPGQFPNAEHAGQTCLAIPFFNRITPDDQNLVVTELRDGVERFIAKKTVSVS